MRDLCHRTPQQVAKLPVLRRLSLGLGLRGPGQRLLLYGALTLLLQISQRLLIFLALHRLRLFSVLEIQSENGQHKEEDEENAYHEVAYGGEIAFSFFSILIGVRIT
jgi:hypothetical protein